MGLLTSHNDQQLVTLLMRGNEAAFGVIFERYRSRIYRFALRFCKSPAISEEITHDVFLKIWHMGEELAKVDNIATYLFTIARNKSLDHLRKVAREESLITDLFRTMKEGHNDTQLILEANESSRLVQEAVDQLSPQKKRVYQLSRDEGLNHEQIAEQLHISKSTVNNHLVESLKQIREYLSRHSPEALVIFAALSLHS